MIPPASPADRRRLWSSLSRRYALTFGLLTMVVVSAFSISEVLASWRGAQRDLERQLQAQASELAVRVDSALAAAQKPLTSLAAFPWEMPGWLSVEDRITEYQRLLQVSALLQWVAHVDARGREQLHVSRREPPRLGSAVPVELGREPLVDGLAWLQLVATEADGGSTLARVSLPALAQALWPGGAPDETRYAVIDRAGRAVLHPVSTRMLRQDLLEPGVRDALWRASDNGRLVLTLDWTGAPIIAAVSPTAHADWLALAVRPRQALTEAAQGTLLRSAIFVGCALLLALLLATYLATRMTRPLLALHRGASALAAGDLGVRIQVHTRDELEDLAHQFNRMAQALQDNVEQLEQRVAEKTRDLAAANTDLARVNAELERANFALRLASEHKSEFLAHMSHELRTPLNAILGFADVLKDGMAGPLNESQREFAGDIHASGLHLLELINDVLDLARIEAGQVVLQPTAFVVREVLDSALAMLRQRCLRAGLALEVEVAPEVGTWVADPRRFKQVLLNLLFNAVKFTRSGGLRVCVAVDAADGLVVSVQDSGMGIAPADHDRIFEPFYQAARDGGAGASDSALQGTGLGLPLARQLVRQHGGDIAVMSRPGAGASFLFNLPRHAP